MAAKKTAIERVAEHLVRGRDDADEQPVGLEVVEPIHPQPGGPLRVPPDEAKTLVDGGHYQRREA
jgi:hypothetical protein